MGENTGLEARGRARPGPRPAANMLRSLGIAALGVLLMACLAGDAALPAAGDPDPAHVRPEDPPRAEIPTRVRVVSRFETLAVDLQAVSDLAGKAGFEAAWDSLGRVLELTREADLVRLVAGAPVAERNGSIVALPAPLRVDEHGRPVLPLFALPLLLDVSLQLSPPAGDGMLPVVTALASPGVEWEPRPAAPRTAEGILEALSFLASPISGARVAGLPDSHLPGAPRGYRSGVHQGFDFYEWAVGVRIDRTTPVLAMADGTVVRADHGFGPPSEHEMNEWTRISAEAGDTPAWILDRLYGRQVWIQHAGGVLVKYGHLDSIPSGIRPGTRVVAGQTVARVGNSGTMSEVLGRDTGLHLHVDILIHGQNVWLALEPGEIRDTLARVLDAGGP